jgi:hypothetical protein
LLNFSFREEKTMVKVSKFLVVLCVLALAGSASAYYADRFVGTTGDNWATAENWSGGVVPDGSNGAELWSDSKIYSGTTVAITPAFYVGYSEGDAAHNVTLTVDGALSTAAGSEIGSYGPSTASMVVNGSYTNNGMGILVGTHGGSGVLDVYGDVFANANGVEVGTYTGDTGTINIFSGGLLDTAYLLIGHYGGTGAIIIHPGGMLHGGNDFLGVWTGYTLDGRIRAASGATLVTTWDGSSATFTATPEPATMLILGLGSLFLARRKK